MAPYSVLGGQSEATIDQANIAMRGMPWYQTQMKAWGQDPGHPTLTSWQRDQLTRQAQANGFVVDQGNIEMDDHGNWNPKGHKLRNTLIVAGLAAAAVATLGAALPAIAGAGGGAGAGAGAGLGAAEGIGAYGVGDAALASLGTGAMGAAALPAAVGAAAALPAGVTLEGTAAGPGAISTAGAAGTPASLVGKTLSADGIAAAKAAGYTVNADGVVMDAANVAPDYIQSASGSSGLVSNLLKYALPVGGGLASSLIAANASSNASAAQTKYLEDALAYEKENDLYKRGVDAAAVQKEAQRYGDYSSRIAPFIDNGISSNDRMAGLVGLPARSGATSGGAYSYGGYSGGGSSGGGGSQGVAITPAITQKILDNYKALGLTPTGSGTGPTDTAYFAEKYAATGGSTPDNDSYWFGPNGRIAKEARQAGVTFGTPSPTSPTSPTPAPPAASSAAPPVTGAPVAKALVTLRAPDGSTRDVSPDQVDAYLARGATRV
jgi:uncharacterized membrane protein YgcG